MRNVLELTNRIAVVLGATSGIGRAIAIGLAEHGAPVVPPGRRQQQLEEVCCQVQAIGVRTLCRTADVTDRDSLDGLRDSVLDTFGGVDILVNAAGYTFKQATATMPEAQWSSLIATNLRGAMRDCQCFYEAWKASGRGR